MISKVFTHDYGLIVFPFYVLQGFPLWSLLVLNMIMYMVLEAYILNMILELLWHCESYFEHIQDVYVLLNFSYEISYKHD